MTLNMGIFVWKGTICEHHFYGRLFVINLKKNINNIIKCSNQFIYSFYADDSTLSTCVPGDNVMDSAGLILTN